MKRKTLTLLAASFILLASSFTFNSCKDCGKKEPKPAGRDSKTSTEGDDKKTPDDQTVQNDDDNAPDNPYPSPAPAPDTIKPKKKSMSPGDIERLVDRVAKYTFDAWFAEEEASKKHKQEDEVAFREKKLKEVVTAREEQGKLVQEVADAEKPEDPATKNNLEAIELLSFKMKREEKYTEYWVAKAEKTAAWRVMTAAWRVMDAAQKKVRNAEEMAAGATQQEYKARTVAENEYEAKEAKEKAANTANEYEAKEAKEKAANTADEDAKGEWDKARENADSEAVKIAREAFIKAFLNKLGGIGKTRDNANDAFEE